MTSEELAHCCAKALLEKQAEDIRVLDLRKLTDIADFFVVASANSPIHLKSLAEVVEELLDNHKVKPYHIEGMSGLRWVLVDAYEVIVHLFLPEVREYYDIEGYWGDAPTTFIDEKD